MTETHEPGTFLFCCFRDCDWELKTADHPGVAGRDCFVMSPQETDAKIIEHMREKHTDAISILSMAMAPVRYIQGLPVFLTCPACGSSVPTEEGS
jgi:hypothetical protein